MPMPESTMARAQTAMSTGQRLRLVMVCSMLTLGPLGARGVRICFSSAAPAVGFARPESGLDGVFRKAAEVVFAAGSAVEEDAGADGGGHDEVRGAVGEPDAVGQTGVRNCLDSHGVAPRFGSKDESEGSL